MSIAKSAKFDNKLVKDRPGSVSDFVKEEIRKRILAKEWTPGSKIPSEFELRDQYKVARVTVRTALRSLETQGLIDIRHGSGAYVADFGDEVRAGLQELRSITGTIRQMGHVAGMINKLAEIRGANKREAAELNIDEGDEVLYLERAITADDEVVAFSYDTFNAAYLDKAARQNIAKGSVFDSLEAIGKHPTRARAEIHAISSNEIGWGKHKPKSNLFIQLSQVHYLRDGKAIFSGDTYFVEGKFQFIIHRTI